MFNLFFPKLLLSGPRMFETGKYSDLTIACGNKSYPVHRALLAPRSTFFEGACRNPFKESETGIIDLTEDDPEAVEHMVHCEHRPAPAMPKSRTNRPCFRLLPSGLSQQTAFAPLITAIGKGFVATFATLSNTSRP